MIDHLSTYAKDFNVTKAFYETVFAPLGYTIQAETAFPDDLDLPGRRICAFGQSQAVFWVVETNQSYTPRHTAFVASNREAVRAFHGAGITIGAKDNGAPGERPEYHEHYYAGFLIDPDGNDVEAVCHLPHP